MPYELLSKMMDELTVEGEKVLPKWLQDAEDNFLVAIGYDEMDRVKNVRISDLLNDYTYGMRMYGYVQGMRTVLGIVEELRKG